jgi:hypothetical protein
LPGLSLIQEIEWAGRNSYLEVRARSPQTRSLGSFIRKDHMTGVSGLFKAGAAFIARFDE